MSIFSKYKVIVFDLGGTLMEYKGMPHNWSGYYQQGFEQVNAANDLNLSKEDIEESVEILKSYNPRFTGREIEIDPEEMFGEIIKKWISKGKCVINNHIYGCDNEHMLDDQIDNSNMLDNQINNSNILDSNVYTHNNIVANSNRAKDDLKFDNKIRITEDELTIDNTIIKKVIDDFFGGINLQPEIYDYTWDLIKQCKDEGCKVACLTDLPSAFPEYKFKKDIVEIVDLFDLYVSSKICGYRKPNKAGIEYIAKKFGVKISDILLIGDEEKDYKTAKNSGCEYIYIGSISEKLNPRKEKQC